MATSLSSSNENELAKKFEAWLSETIESYTSGQDIDASVFINYILSTLSEEDNSDEEKSEAIQPFLQELNQNNSFDEEKFLQEILKTWNSMKQEFENGYNQGKKLDDNEPNPTDTILSMINKHKTQLIKVKKTETRDDDYEHAEDNFVYEESDDEDESSSKKDDGLFENSNMSDAQSRDKVKRDQLADLNKAHMKQKEQSKKALIEQRQKEEDRKKKAQQKAAKVERKR